MKNSLGVMVGAFLGNDLFQAAVRENLRSTTSQYMTQASERWVISQSWASMNS